MVKEHRAAVDYYVGVVDWKQEKRKAWELMEEHRAALNS